MDSSIISSPHRSATKQQQFYFSFHLSNSTIARLASRDTNRILLNTFFFNFKTDTHTLLVDVSLNLLCPSIPSFFSLCYPFSSFSLFLFVDVSFLSDSRIATYAIYGTGRLLGLNSIDE